MITLPVVVLLTVNDHETHAVLDEFCGVDGVPNVETRGGITYNLLGVHSGMQIVHTISEMGAGGVGAAQQRTRQAIQHWNARAIVAVGIAFGLDKSKQHIGDVLVSDQLQDYELGRINDDGTVTPRGDKLTASDTLINRLRQTNSIQTRRKNKVWPIIRPGLVLSGQKLVDNFDYRESLKKLHTEAIGGEMEGTGLYVSATEFKTDWVVVKAICDWGYNKNLEDKEVNQKVAARNSAFVVKTAIDMGNLYPDEKRIEVNDGQNLALVNEVTSLAPQDDSSIHGENTKIWFTGPTQADHVSVATSISELIYKGIPEVEIDWPSELLALAKHVKFILTEIQARTRSGKLDKYDSKKLASFVSSATYSLNQYETLIANAGNRIPLMIKGVRPYYAFPPENMVERYLALCIFDAGYQLFKYAKFEPYRDSSVLAPWESIYADPINLNSYGGINRGKCLKSLLACDEEVYAAHLSEVSGYQLEGYQYFFGPKSLIMKFETYSQAAIHNRWFYEWIIPQMELLLVYRDSDEVVFYNEKAHINKICDEEFEQI